MSSGSADTSGGGLSPILTRVARRWRLALAVLVLATGAAVASALLSPAKYQSTAKVLISTRDLAGAVAGVSGNGLNDSADVATEAQIAGLDTVVDQAKDAVGVSGGPAADAKVELKVAGTPGSADPSNVLEIEAVSTDRTYSQRLASAVAERYVAYRRDLSTRDVRAARQDLSSKLSELAGRGQQGTALYSQLSGRLQLLDTLLILGSSRATLLESGAAVEQVAPRPVRSGLLGFLAGIVLAIAVAVVVDRLDRRTRSHDEISELLGTPVLGTLPDPRRSVGAQGPVPVAVSDPTGAAAEAFRTLRLNLKFATATFSGRSILVTSAHPGEGKTYVATNLAVSAASSGGDVVLIDLDLRKPAAHTWFAIPRAPGLSDVIAGSVTLEDALVTIPLPKHASPDGRLRFLPAGRRVPNPGEFAASEAVAAEVRRIASSRPDLVIIDTPPLLAVSDATALSEVSDATVVVVRADGADRSHLERLRGVLAAGTHRTIGVVLTAAWGRRDTYGTYDGVYGDEGDELHDAGLAPGEVGRSIGRPA